MLGDIVEFEFTAQAGAAVITGAEIGSIEGLKALTTVFRVRNWTVRRREPGAPD
jgi:hypothetical protein